VKKSISKFKGISYPFFGLKLRPYEIRYDLTKIYVQKQSGGHTQTVDDKSLQGDYFARLLQLEHRLHFEYTCRDLQDVIFNKVKWGIDATATPFDLTAREKVQTKTAKIEKVKGNLIWFRTISYPFTLPTTESLELTDAVYAVLVRTQNEWFIKEFFIDKPFIAKEVYI
jgi:hypothetical protein